MAHAKYLEPILQGIRNCSNPKTGSEKRLKVFGGTERLENGCRIFWKTSPVCSIYNDLTRSELPTGLLGKVRKGKLFFFMSIRTTQSLK